MLRRANTDRDFGIGGGDAASPMSSDSDMVPTPHTPSPDAATGGGAAVRGRVRGQRAVAIAFPTPAPMATPAADSHTLVRAFSSMSRDSVDTTTRNILHSRLLSRKPAGAGAGVGAVAESVEQVVDDDDDDGDVEAGGGHLPPLAEFGVEWYYGVESAPGVCVAEVPQQLGQPADDVWARLHRLMKSSKKAAKKAKKRAGAMMTRRKSPRRSGGGAAAPTTTAVAQIEAPPDALSPTRSARSPRAVDAESKRDAASRAVSAKGKRKQLSPRMSTAATAARKTADEASLWA
jgi:hypothetical protein